MISEKAMDIAATIGFKYPSAAIGIAIRLYPKAQKKFWIIVR